MNCTDADVFNPDEALRRLPSLTIERRDGSTEAVNTRVVVVQGGANAYFLPDSSGEANLLQVEAGAGIENPYYRQKYNALVSLSDSTPTISGPYEDPYTGFTPEGPAWSFSLESLWIGGINGVHAQPDSGVFFVVGDRCFSVGEFADQPGNPLSAPDSVLKLLDICAPCLDCLHYQRLDQYLQRISAFFDYQLELVRSTDTGTPPTHPDGGTPDTFVGVHPQLMATLRYWDSLVHRSMVKLSAQSQGQSMVVAGFYRNISLDTVGLASPTGVAITFVFEAFEDGVPWAGMTSSKIGIRALDRANKPSAQLAATEVWSPSSSGADTLTVYMKSTDPLASGEEIYADLALLFKDTTLFNDPSREYVIDVTMTASQTHLDPASQTRTTRVYFQPPEPQGST